MLIGAEIALLCVGLYALFAGKTLSNAKSTHVVRGTPARVIGAICVLPLPLAFLLGFAVAFGFAAQGIDITKDKSFFWVATAIEGGIILICVLMVVVLTRVYRTPLGLPTQEATETEVPASDS